jgi:hypothetical protein
MDEIGRKSESLEAAPSTRDEEKRLPGRCMDETWTNEAVVCMDEGMRVG